MAELQLVEDIVLGFNCLENEMKQMTETYSFLNGECINLPILPYGHDVTRGQFFRGI